MAVRKQPQKFVTSDGVEFDTQARANRHERFVEAKAGYESAIKLFGAAIAETQTTADGEPFTLGWRKYYTILNSWTGLPRLHEVEFTQAYWQEFEVDELNRVALVFNERNSERTRHRVADLYANYKAAQKALLAAQQQRLGELQQEVEKLRLEVEEGEHAANDRRGHVAPVAACHSVPLPAQLPLFGD